jgi:nucleoid-associated protein YgaU
MFASRSRALLLLLAIAVVVALWLARPTTGAGVETRYVVQPGDTLWALAAERYEGDPREAVWRIKERNGLATSLLVPGMVLALPGS